MVAVTVVEVVSDRKEIRQLLQDHLIPSHESQQAKASQSVRVVVLALVAWVAVNVLNLSIPNALDGEAYKVIQNSPLMSMITVVL